MKVRESKWSVGPILRPPYMSILKFKPPSHSSWLKDVFFKENLIYDKKKKSDDFTTFFLLI